MQFTQLHLNGFYTHHGLFWCSHIRNTISTHSTHRGSTKDVVTDITHPTTYITPTCLTRWYPAFYRYLCTYILIANKQFLLLIDIPIQDRSQQITIDEVFTLNIPHTNFSAHYDINAKYLGITKDETMALELSITQFQFCQVANGQFCSITTPFQPLANPLSCVSALYAKNLAGITSWCSLQIWKTSNINLLTQISPDVWILTAPVSTLASTFVLICPRKATASITIRKPVHILRIPTACSVTLSNFHLPPRYQTSNLDFNVSFNVANLHMVNVSALDFHIWQHIKDNRNETQLQHLTTILLILVNKIHQHIINGTQHIMPFDTTDESTEDTNLIWTLFLHTGTYVTAIGLLIPAGLWIFYYFFWCWPARLAHWPLEPGNMQYTILDDDVEVAPIYRHDGKVLPPTRPCENHGLAIEHLPTWMESWCKQQSKSLVVPV